MQVDDLVVTASGAVLGARVGAEQAVTAGQLRERDRRRQDLEAVSVSSEPAPMLAVQAGRLAWSRHPGRSADQAVAHILACSTPSGGPMWSAAAYVAAQVLGAERVRDSVQLSTACSGALHGLADAVRRLRCDPATTSCLVTAADSYDPATVDRWAADPGLVLGDGAGAVVLARSGPGHRVLSVTTGADVSLEPMYRAGTDCRFEDSRPQAPVRLQDRLQQTLAGGRSGLTLRTIVARHEALLVEVVDRALAEAGTDHSGVRRWVLPFVGRHALRHGYLDPLGIEAAATSADLARTTGHLGAADPFVGLDAVEAAGTMSPGDLVVLVGVGTGQTVGCAVLQW